MASTESDIITTVKETHHESSAEIAKQKLTVPRRIMEEEVWFSGSELKTDNSSSDDENAQHSTDVQDRIKKGAKKKTKTISHSARTKKQIIRESNQDTITETTISSSSTAGNYDVIIVDPNEVQWRPKRGSITLPGLATELERVQI